MINLKKYGLNFKESILKWDEAVPLGNGKLGALIYGGGPIRFAIDRIDLWDNRPSEASLNKDFTYKKLIELVQKGEAAKKEKHDIFEINSKFPYPTKLSAGWLEIDFFDGSDNVHSSLDILKACATVRYNDHKIESFICANRQVGVIRIYGDYKAKLHIPDYFSGDENGNWSAPSGLFYNDGTPEIIENGCLKYPRSKVVEDGGFLFYKQDTHTEYSFGVVVLTVKRNGFDELYYTVVTSDDKEDFIGYAKEILLAANDVGYDGLKREHESQWKKYWGKSQVSIPDKEFEKTYYFSWYLFACTSRKGGYPMPLQGVWTTDSNAIPPWNGDYHHDTNTQMSYWGYAKANRLEEGRVFADYLWDLKDAFSAHTKKVYGVEGILLPGCSTLDGKFMGGCVQYSLSPSMTIWAAKAFDDYYFYTGDTDFLRNRAFPFFQEVAKAITALLVEKNGKYYLPLPSTPEIYEGEMREFYVGNTNFDLSLLIYLFKTLLRYCSVLNENGEAYRKILEKLDDLYVSKDNVLMVSDKLGLPFSHRHFSHMMSIYPLHILNYDTDLNKKIIDSTLLEIEQLGTGWWVGFSFPWCALMYAMQYNGNAAREKLRVFVKGFLSKNGFHLNGDYKKYGFSQWHYRPFTLEALFAYCDAIQEMLLQENKGYIELFPAMPEEWESKASFKRLRSYQGVLVSAELKNGVAHKALLESKKSVTVKLLNNFGSDTLCVNENGKERIVQVKQGETIEICLQIGKTEIWSR